MNVHPAQTIDARAAPPIEILAPARQAGPVIFASPHSGRDYSAAFVAASRLDQLALRRSEDCYVDQIFGAAPMLGAPLLHALFPRVYIDPNREPYELDPEMFSDDLPEFANTASVRVAGGIGTIARVAASGAEIYDCKLSYADAAERIERCYRPYHDALAALVRETQSRFRCALVLDCHSMPSIAGPDESAPARRPDMVLGNRFGASCAPVVMDTARRLLREAGYSVAHNMPYAGGYTTQRYGRPDEGLHALQIEINRALYIDEETLEPLPAMAGLTEHMTELAAALLAIDPGRLAPA
jgi:N-formylglutamate amidohydrolase